MMVGREGTHEVLVEHVVRGAGDARVVASALPDELEEVVDAGEDVVHEDDGVEHLALRVAELVERPSVELDAPEDAEKRPSCLGPLPAPPAEVSWWLVSGSPMLFENVGFSKAVERTGE